MTFSITPEQIDAVLPQTQCGLCGYGGCMPYAKALLQENAAINLCPPGGVKGLRAIGDLMKVDPEPFVPEMEKVAKPSMLAIIREAECIGCAKCITACPVDAILGSAKSMHTVIADACTGCELCIEPCPVDCIDMVVVAEPSEKIKNEKAAMSRIRFQTREERLSREKEEEPRTSQKAQDENQNIDAKKAYILQAIERAKQKKLQI